MNIELTQQEIVIIQKALKTHQYIVERIINGDQIINEPTLKEAIDTILTIKSINIKLNNNE